MGTIGKDYKFKIIQNFLTKEEQKLLKEYCIIKHRIFLSDPNQGKGSMHMLTTWFYGDAIMDALLVTKKEFIEKEINKKIIPSYSFWRVYTEGDSLAKHKDRPSCEISLSITIDGTGKWPLLIDGQEINLNNGDAVVYLGKEVLHWREELKTDYQSQCFLHYVDVDGPYVEFALDKRQALGIDKR